MDTNISEISIKGIFKLNMNAIFKITSRIGRDIDPTLDQVMGPILMYVQSKCSPTFCEFKADRKRSCFKNLTLGTLFLDCPISILLLLLLQMVNECAFPLSRVEISLISS